MKKLYATLIFFSFFLLNYAQVTFEENKITSYDFQALSISSVYSTDIDGDGDLDLLTASELDDKIAWYENFDGLGSFSLPKIITLDANGANDVYAADIDGDGDMDVLSSAVYGNDIAWYENLDGQGNFSSLILISDDANNARSVYSKDLDGDGDLDVLSANSSGSKLAWYENIDGLGTFGNQQIISSSLSGPFSVYAGDLDGDGDNDVLCASSFDGKVTWFENTNGQGTFGTEQIITTSASGAEFVTAADFDADGDLDVLSTSFIDDKIAWYENIGQGSFGAQQIISNLADDPRSVVVKDLDNDGDLDILSVSSFNNKISLYENTNGLGDFVIQQIISSDFGDLSVHAADFDGDGDIDVVSSKGNNAYTFENLNGIGNFSSAKPVIPTTDEPRSIFPADIDADGDFDILCASEDDNKISWFENLDGQGTFGVQKVVSSLEDAISVLAADVDGDNDLDIVASGHSSSSRTVWFENLDGLGNFGPEQIILYGVGFNTSIQMIDIDGDNDLDLLSDASN